MPSFHGKLVAEDTVLAVDLEIWIVEGGGAGALRSWSGSFDLPEKHSFSFYEHSQCEIVLTDGRKGTIIPTRCNGMTVEFQGSGVPPAPLR